MANFSELLRCHWEIDAMTQSQSVRRNMSHWSKQIDMNTKQASPNPCTSLLGHAQCRPSDSYLCCCKPTDYCRRQDAGNLGQGVWYPHQGTYIHIQQMDLQLAAVEEWNAIDEYYVICNESCWETLLKEENSCPLVWCTNDKTFVVKKRFIADVFSVFQSSLFSIFVTDLAN